MTTQMKLESGRWEGEYIDVSGHRGALTLTLEVRGDEVFGKYELALRTEDQQSFVSGEVEGRVEGENVRFLLALGANKERLSYSAHLSDAGSYARQALYSTVDSGSEAGFGRGVWIAWRFAGTGN
jgi:hypothetical protein